MDLLIKLIEFCVFIFLQGLFINGVNECCKGGCIEDMNTGKKCDGMIIWRLWPNFFERNKDKAWSRPFFSCVKCMSSVHGALTYWPAVIYLFGFNWVEIPVFVFDVFILVVVNFFIYKRL